MWLQARDDVSARGFVVIGRETTDMVLVTVGRDDYVKLTVASLSDIIRDHQHLFAGLDTFRHSGAAEID
jgi:hypothetical protein